MDPKLTNTPQPGVANLQNIVPPRHKEGEPLAAPDIAPTIREVNLAPELREAGVEVKKEEPAIPPDLHAAGHVVPAANESMPVTLSQTPSVVLPMSQEEAAEALKSENPGESRRWLAALIQKILKVKNAFANTKNI